MAISGKEGGGGGGKGGGLQEKSLFRDIGKKAWQCTMWSHESCSKSVLHMPLNETKTVLCGHSST